MSAARSPDESGLGDASLPAKATITATHRYGRVLRGFPLRLAVVLRNLTLGLVPAMITDGFLPWFVEDEPGPPQYLLLRDRASGRKLARLALGRGFVSADVRREAIEYDLGILGREQFLKRHLRDRERQ